MNYEVKNAKAIGGATVGETTTIQYVNVTVGVVGCPYVGIKVERTEPYEFANSLTIEQAVAGIPAWANQWCIDNYPTT